MPDHKRDGIMAFNVKEGTILHLVWKSKLIAAMEKILILKNSKINLKKIHKLLQPLLTTIISVKCLEKIK